ncbi:hypothetical protein [Halorussus salinus]|uniref:hypothetical protein n=1 Tax=Halorussus salinus TaxID=1364935 RepID=UPI0010925407|nr:hypothetical protein [Halorussus salinus]
MQDFVVDGESRAWSIGFDATKRDGVLVTVGVLVNRTQEARLLERLYVALSDDGYRPFRTKSRDLSLPPRKLRGVLLRCAGKVGICVHRDYVTLSYAEATHSAILLDELGVPTTDAVVIMDGDESRADLLYHAASGIEVVPPPVVNCARAELYYPHLLLADFVAGAVAGQIRSDSTVVSGVSPGGSVVSVKDTTGSSHAGRWDRGYAAAARSEGETPRPAFEQRYADSLRERVSCWFRGQFGNRDSLPPTSDGIAPVVGRLEAVDCEAVATWLSEQ